MSSLFVAEKKKSEQLKNNEN